ncbi:MAG: hypothetical protein O3A95_00500 [Planctomycetota bacterium]|nr:hypothetical protein [Planctomycetota bacterium]MDA1112770.1 hypothetical protein [Planctomycetota bacterium]
MQRLPQGRALGSAEDILTGLQGALWLDCLDRDLDDATATRALRRALYREYEVTWKRQTFSIGEVLPYLHAAEAPLTKLELPQHAQAFADAYLLGHGSEGSLQRAMPQCRSRRMVRCLNTMLLELITDGQPLRDLKRRAARLMASLARDGVTKRHAQEVRNLKRALRMLEPCAEVCKLQHSLKGIPSGN